MDLVAGQLVPGVVEAFGFHMRLWQAQHGAARPWGRGRAMGSAGACHVPWGADDSHATGAYTT